ncbi:glutathione S-transferase family protein [Sulfurirhabdus autotrophica]|uniref:Glutathione S-transferase n=1 Tax=Sulfurirhabdus autotrophica TaxID=1706046 RepID=A0A4R3Y3W3_9PROT|nr:glutathione S-transferase [Sulfurirhabdus autotrophica]TCV86420.1 glutathione S-transferase [Sulfurirhabdus autotrophica]
MNPISTGLKSAANPAQPIKLYRHPISGHCHRVELFLSLLNLPIELIHINLTSRAQKSPEFLAMNPFGQIPVIQDGATTLADANAILVYLAHKYVPDTWLPLDSTQAAQVQRWLSVAAGLLAFGPAAARVAVLFNAPINTVEAIARANNLFGVMEQTLSQTPFLVGSNPTLADIANYSYIARAPEGNVSLQPYPNLRAWLARIEALPGFVPMTTTPVGLVA